MFSIHDAIGADVVFKQRDWVDGSALVDEDNVLTMAMCFRSREV